MVSYGAGAGRDAAREPQFARRITHLRARAESAYREYQATRYEATGRLIAELIREVETAAPGSGVQRPSHLRSPRACIRQRRGVCAMRSWRTRSSNPSREHAHQSEPNVKRHCS
jgi:hypothetical protein